MTRPLLKWPGGKSRQAAEIAAAIGPVRGTYYEPFVGSAAVYLHLRSAGLVERAVLSDVNERLLDVHREVRDDVEAVLRILGALPVEGDWRGDYYGIRKALNDGYPGLMRAARMIWLNHACFNGLYRENQKGEFNVAAGDYARISLPTHEHFREVSGLLRGAHIDVRDFRDSLQLAGPGDVVYLDPPYVPISKTSSFAAYSADGFDYFDQIDLAIEAQNAATRGARAVISNHDLPATRGLYCKEDGFRLVRTSPIRRSISCKGTARAAVAEGLWVIGGEMEAVAP
jgi:DNA adenine methylase